MPHDYSEVPPELLAPFVSYVDMIVFDDFEGIDSNLTLWPVK